MRKLAFILYLFLFGIAQTGTAQTGIARDMRVIPSVEAGAPQTLPLIPLQIRRLAGKETGFDVQVARTLEQQEVGLMWRKRLPRREGMLFIFPEAKQATFWMRNTLISLDLIFIRSDGSIVNIAANAKPLSLDMIPSKGRVIAVLEIGGGQAKALGIRAGQQVCHADLPPCLP